MKDKRRKILVIDAGPILSMHVDLVKELQKRDIDATVLLIDNKGSSTLQQSEPTRIIAEQKILPYRDDAQVKAVPTKPIDAITKKGRGNRWPRK